MGKGIDLGLAGPDDPIYKGGLRVSSLPVLNESTSDSQNDTDGTDPMQPAVDQIEQALAAKDARYMAEREKAKRSSGSTTRKPSESI